MPHANLTRDEAATRASVVADVSYEVELDLTGSDGTFPSRTRVRFRGDPGASTFIDLQARHIDEAVLNGRPLPEDAVSPTRLRLDGLEADNELVVSARCGYERSGVGLHRFTDPVDGRVYLHTQFEPFEANRVYACFDQPDLKARVTLTVHAPEEWVVVANTAPESVEGGTWRFGETLPIPTYISALAAGPYHAEKDVWRASDGSQELPLGLYCRDSLARYVDTEEFFEITRQGLDFFREAFDHPYPFGPYDQVFVPEFNWGAMENPGCVTYTEQFVFRSKVTDGARQARASTILHEMAHMWFGNLVTMRWWDDLWLNESFATYMGTRALAEATRFTDAWASFHSSIKAWAVAQDQLPSTHPISADIVDAQAVRTHFDGITYAKGASVLKQLVAWVGDDAFYEGIRDYFRQHAYGNATLADFLGALERPSGRDLGPWSKQWLETSGVATLRPVVTVSASGALDRVEVAQEAPEEHSHVRDHRLAVGCYTDNGRELARTSRAELDLRGPRTEVEGLSGAPVPDLLIVNDDDLAYGKLRLDERSVGTLLDGLGRLTDPLARALCWGAAWDMVRDAELAARRFVELVADHAHAEEDVALLQTQVQRARAAADYYGDPANRTAARSRLGVGARAALEASEPGSDAQLVWARTLASASVGDGDLAWVRDLLDGGLTVPGLAVDTDFRWHLLTTLAKHGWAGPERIAEEERRDATDMGARRAAEARAARPQAGAKEEAWSALLSDEVTLAMRRSLCSGLWQYEQEDVLEPFIGRYPDAVARVWRDRNPEEAISLTSGLYPATIVADSAVRAADAALADEALPAPGRRIVAEERDQTLRALRARKIDRD